MAKKMARRGANGSGSLLLEPIPSGVKGAGLRNFAFINVSYTVPPGLLSRKKQGNIILDSISGVMYPGVNAILGPTGSGKTTLLDILANRKSSSRVGGRVLFNSEDIMPNFRFKTGYVVQDDVVTGSLTVRENLHFSAALRLPSTMNSRQRSARVEKVIKELNLHNCADQKIGTEFIRGVSGGERKRTNIGMELIIEPQVLFLDEPTTGLDAHTAVTVVQLLKDLTSGGERIVVISIHQPRYSIVKLFDTLTLLSLGKLVYHGDANKALGYFNELGFRCEEHDNPADFYLDVIDSCEEKQEDTDSVHHTGGSREHLLLKDQEEGPLLREQRVNLSQCFLSSQFYSNTQSTLQSMIREAGLATEETPTIKEAAKECCSNPYVTNVFWQFLIVAYRAALQMWRNPMTSVIQLVVMVIFAVLVGAIYIQRPDTPRGLQDKLGALFFIVMSIVFSGLGAIELFIKEKISFLHETSSGYYRVSVFFIAKVITDLLILRTVPLSVFSVITYLMIGFQPDISKFLLFYLTLCFTTIGGAAIAFTFSALVNMFAVAHLLVSLIFVFYMLFGGLMIGLSSLPSWIQWMQYASLFRYSVEALVVNEMNGNVYFEEVEPGTDDMTCYFHVTRINDTLYCSITGEEFLSFQGYRTDWEWYIDQIALLVIVIFWLCLTYLILRLAKKYYEHYK